MNKKFFITSFKAFESYDKYFSDEEAAREMDDEEDNDYEDIDIIGGKTDFIESYSDDTRGMELYEGEFIETLKSECTEFLEGGKAFYRGMKKNHDFSLYKPSEHTRKSSGNTPNYYNMLFDLLPSWKKI